MLLHWILDTIYNYVVQSIVSRDALVNTSCPLKDGDLYAALCDDDHRLEYFLWLQRRDITEVRCLLWHWSLALYPLQH